MSGDEMVLEAMGVAGPVTEPLGIALRDTPSTEIEKSESVKTKARKKSAVHVRLPRDEDWAGIREIVRRHHARTIFADLPFSDRKFDALESSARNPAPHQCLIVAELRGVVVGLAWFSAGEYLLSEGGLMTTVHIVAVDRERCGGYVSAQAFMRLMRGVVIWSKSLGVDQVLVHVTTGRNIKEADRLIRNGGGIFIGGSYLTFTFSSEKEC